MLVMYFKIICLHQLLLFVSSLFLGIDSFVSRPKSVIYFLNKGDKISRLNFEYSS